MTSSFLWTLCVRVGMQRNELRIHLWTVSNVWAVFKWVSFNILNTLIPTWPPVGNLNFLEDDHHQWSSSNDHHQFLLSGWRSCPWSHCKFHFGTVRPPQGMTHMHLVLRYYKWYCNWLTQDVSQFYLECVLTGNLVSESHTNRVHPWTCHPLCNPKV